MLSQARPGGPGGLVFSAVAFARAPNTVHCVDDPAQNPVRIPISGELDLHTFRPEDLGVLLPAYLEECLRHGVVDVRVIHGKGTGQLRASVHALLRRLPHVERFWNADETAGGWGATRVRLRAATA